MVATVIDLMKQKVELHKRRWERAVRDKVEMPDTLDLLEISYVEAQIALLLYLNANAPHQN